MNLALKKPDGVVTLVNLTPEALERMAEARKDAALLEQKIPLVAEQAAQQSVLEFLEEDIEAKRNAVRDQRFAMQDKLAGGAADAETAARVFREVAVMTDELEQLEAALAKLEAQRLEENKKLAELDAQLATIARVEAQRDSEGLDEEGHERVLRAKREIPDDHVAVGYRVALPPADPKGEFRGAWIWSGGILVDLERARAIKRDQVRALRKPRFAELDCAQLRALEQNDTAAQAAIGAQKQALRDAPADPAIAKAATLDELKAAMPECLK